MPNPREALVRRLRRRADAGGPVAEVFARVAEIEAGESPLAPQEPPVSEDGPE